MCVKKNPSGVALIITLLTLTILSLIVIGFFFLVTGEQRNAISGTGNNTAFYGAEAAIENMSAQLDQLFSYTAAPTPEQINALSAQPPSIPGITFPAQSTQYPNGGYYIAYQTNGSGGLQSTSGTIGGTGPLAGLQGDITPFTLTAIADGPSVADGSSSTSGARKTEVELIRQVQEVAVPVFEFGIFSNSDLDFFAGPDFNFGGRVATNGNLYLAEGDGATLTLPSIVTAYGNVIREQLENGWPTSSNYNGTVNVDTSPGNYRALAQSEGSVTGGPGSSANPDWPTISLTDYDAKILTSATTPGARKLNMAMAMPGAGGTPIQIIERAQASDSALVSQARLENQASLRILLSDSTSDLPDGGGAVSLSAPFPSTWYTVDSCHAPLAESPGPVPVLLGISTRSPLDLEADNDFLTPAGTPLLGGYIEIDMQTSSGTWQNVTTDVLQQGITSNADMPGTCQNHPVIHLEEPNTWACNPNPGIIPGPTSGPCVSSTVGSTKPYDFVPINIYDTREGNARDVNDGSIHLGGVMNVIELDVGNLQRWFATDSYGSQALFNGGYIVYFSDRRGNYDPAATATNGETGMYGNEDIINPASSTGAPDGVMEEAEDVDGPNAGTSNYGQDTFDRYGATPPCIANPSAPGYCGVSSLYAGLTPQSVVSAGTAEKNAVIFFRRTLRLTDGTLGNLPPLTAADCSIAEGANGSGGFTVASENPVYILGNYNANNSTFSDISGVSCHVPASVMGDAVTLLSNSWNDAESFSSPTNSGGRTASAVAYYRTAVMGGSTVPFTQPTGYTTYQDFGTDGGVHNFLRMLENWGSSTQYYTGSIADFYYSVQATGVYKDGLVNSVYSPPARAYSFDTDFESISELPPGTPRFTDVNALAFQQVTLSQ
ncbi:MAG: hypothetical protein ACRD3O_03165 [Terriglobia bacterium]